MSADLGMHAHVASGATGGLYGRAGAIIRDAGWGDEITSDPIANFVDLMEQPWRGDLAVLVLVDSAFGPYAPLPTAPAARAEPLVEDSNVDCTVEEATHDLREMLDLSVSDLARMVGIQRRRFYDLMEGASPSEATARRITALHSLIVGLRDAVGGNPQYLRSAILTPLGPDRRTIYEAATDDAPDELSRLVTLMLDRIEGGTARFGRRPVPRRPRGSSDQARARTEIEALPRGGE